MGRGRVVEREDERAIVRGIEQLVVIHGFSRNVDP